MDKKPLFQACQVAGIYGEGMGDIKKWNFMLNAFMDFMIMVQYSNNPS